MQIRVCLRVLAVSLLISVAQLYGQVDTGVILGTVKDQSGAVIPGANVTLKNQGTGLSVSLVTAGDGSYVFRPVKIGTYTLAAQFKGFETVQHTDVTVDVQQQVVVNFTLQPGQVTQSIEVSGAPPSLQTQDASVGQVVGSRTINDLPLNGRNYTFLAQLAAGVTQDQQDTRGLGASGSFAANGTRPAQNNYLLDGIDDNADLVDFLNGTAYVVRPPVDAIQEFKVQTSDYSAEMGRSAGAVVNAAIKSGSNQFHGNAWEFVRNDIFDAANFFENSPTPTPKGEYRQNQFGATIGGPIRRDKTFFFGDYEGTRIRQAIPNVSTVPTALQRSSGYTNLTELIAGQAGPGAIETDNLNRTFPLGTVFDPSTTRPVVQGQVDPATGLTAASSGFIRDPFYVNGEAALAGISDFTTPAQTALLNQLPASRLDPNAISLLNLFPSPTSSSLYNNYSSDPILRNTVNQFDARVDQNFSDKDQLFGRVSYSDNPEFLPGPFTGIADGGSFTEGTQTVVSINSVLSETHAFSPTLVNEARVGFSRIGASRVQPYAKVMGIPAKYGIQGIPQVTDNGGLGSIFITGLNTLGSNEFLPSVEYNSTVQFTDNLTKVYGKQTLKVGMEFQHIKFAILQPPAGRGDWTFSGAFTNVPETNAGNTGMAQMLIVPIEDTEPGANDMFVGGADNMGASNYANTDMGRNYYGYYFQDDWKATSKFTLNLGVRWEYFGQIVENYGAQSNFLPTNGSDASQFILTKSRCNTPLSASFLAAAQTDNINISCSSQPGLGHSQLSNFSPRVGFAYRITPRLVARGGFGIFYGGFENSVVETYVDFPFQFSLGYPSLTTAQPITFPNGAIGTLETGLSAITPLTSAAAQAGGVSFTGEDYHMKSAYTEGYNLALQYEVTTNQTFQVNYVGNSVRHLGVYINPNNPSEILPPGLNSYAYSPFPDFQNSITYSSMAGDSYYNSLQTNFERRFSAGLDLLANFTYSACRTNGSDVLNETGLYFRAPMLPHFGIQGDYGRCDFDDPKVVHLSGSYELPVGKGKRLLTNGGRFVEGALGGWKTNGILTLEDGMPGNVPCVNSTTSGFGCNALLVPGQSIIGGPHNVNAWLNPAAFTNPPVATTIGQSDYAPLGGAPMQFYGPGYHRIDFSLFKDFRTSDKTHLEFRSEFFNLVNHPNFSPPGFSGNGVVAAPGSLDYTSPSTFGTISSTRDGQNDQREIQFALKFYF